MLSEMREAVSGYGRLRIVQSWVASTHASTAVYDAGLPPDQPWPGIVTQPGFSVSGSQECATVQSPRSLSLDRETTSPCPLRAPVVRSPARGPGLPIATGAPWSRGVFGPPAAAV